MSRARPPPQRPQQARRRPVGLRPGQIGRDAAVELPEGAHLVLAQALQAALPSPLHQIHVPGPLLALLAGHGGRLQARASAPRRVPGRLQPVEPRQLLVGGARVRLRVVLQRKRERIDHRACHPTPDLPAQPLAPRHVACKQLELRRRKHGTPHAGRGKLVAAQAVAAGRVADDHGSGNEVAQPLRAPVDQDADAADQPGHSGLQVDHPDEVAQHRAAERERLAPEVEHPQPDDALPWRSPAAEPLEEQKVPPLRKEGGEDQDGPARRLQDRAQIPGVVDAQADGEARGDKDREVDRERGGPRPQIRQDVVEANVLGGVHRDPAVESA